MKKSAIWSWGLVLALVLVMALATVVEANLGMCYGRAWVYGTWWFRLLWLALAATGLWHIIRCRLWRRFVLAALHVALLMILAGAALTAITSHRGYLHLREGDTSDIYADDNSRVRHLPFEARLDSFRIQYYPGTQTPRDYISNVEMGGTKYRISMNRIARIEGYRFYQSSYDRDGHGTILRVNYDPWGTGVTYAGYLLLGISMVVYLIMGSSLLKRGKAARSAAVLLPLFLCSSSLQAADSSFVVPLEQAQQKDYEQVLWQGRPAPLGTLAKDFLQKLYGKRTYKDLTATQVFLSWQQHPGHWADEPIIAQKDSGYACLNDFMDYSVMPPRLKGVEHDPYLAEKVSLALMLVQERLVQPLPAEVRPRGKTSIAAELFYNRLDWTLWGMIGCWLLVVGVSAPFLCIAEPSFKEPCHLGHGDKCGKIVPSAFYGSGLLLEMERGRKSSLEQWIRDFAFCRIVRFGFGNRFFTPSPRDGCFLAGCFLAFSCPFGREGSWHHTPDASASFSLA